MFPPLGDVPDSKIKLSPVAPALAGRLFTAEPRRKPHMTMKRKKSESEVVQSCPTLCDPMDTRLLRLWDFLGKSTRVGCHFLLQGIFRTQGSNPGLPHCRQTLYRLSHQGSPSVSKNLDFSESSREESILASSLLLPVAVVDVSCLVDVSLQSLSP